VFATFQPRRFGSLWDFEGLVDSCMLPGGPWTYLVHSVGAVLLCTLSEKMEKRVDFFAVSSFMFSLLLWWRFLLLLLLVRVCSFVICPWAFHTTDGYRTDGLER